MELCDRPGRVNHRQPIVGRERADGATVARVYFAVLERHSTIVCVVRARQWRLGVIGGRLDRARDDRVLAIRADDDLCFLCHRCAAFGYTANADDAAIVYENLFYTETLAH